MKVKITRSSEFIETDRIQIEINNIEYDIIQTEDNEIRIMKEFFGEDGRIYIRPEVSNVICIK